MLKVSFLFGFLSLLLASCGPNIAEIQAQAVVSQQRLEEHQKHYVFTTDEINRCKATPGKSSDQIESHIRNSMADPDAVKIRNLSKGPLVLSEIKQNTTGALFGSKSSSSLCGWLWSAEVNGKNSYGAYVGYQRFCYIDQFGLKNEKLGFVLIPNNSQPITEFDPDLLTNDSYASEYSAWNFRVTR
jgi:hypothetical protein